MTTDMNIFHRLSGPPAHDILAGLRAEAPVHALELPEGARVWLVTSYADARQALADGRLSKRMARGTTSGATSSSPTSSHMLSSDPPDHTRLRRLVSAGFTARRVERLEPRITAIATELLDAMAGHDEVDLIDAFAFPLPIQVICELLGIPSGDQESFRAWSNLIVEGSFTNGPGRVEALRLTLSEMVAYIHALLADKRRTPGDDLLSALLTVREEGERLTEDELTAMVFLMLIAGHETTVNLIGNGVFLLLTHPGQRQRLAAEPDLLPSAIEEFLRYEGPVQTSSYRITTEPVELSGVRIPAGEPVLISLLSANRDATQFTEPDRLDITRTDAAHLAFGHGIHFCLGAALARLEGRIAIGALLTRYPDISLAAAADTLDWRQGLLVHGLKRLPVTLAPAARS